jgi:YebC/PmpR family DNA-binding regulatory protein
MSGHSKWSTIKHKKGVKDARRGAMFTKMIKQLTIAAREGGSDIDANFALRSIVDKAKAVNMPNDTIARAIKRGAGELPGQELVEAWYEGYGPNGIAFLVQTLSDNKNRLAAELRHTFSRHQGNLGEPGSVSWMFDRKGYIEVSQDKMDEDSMMETALEAGAEDVQIGEEVYEIYTEPSAFQSVARALTQAGIEYLDSELSMIPKTPVSADEKTARSVLKLVEVLEENDDVQNVFTNADISDEVMQTLSNED